MVTLARKLVYVHKNILESTSRYFPLLSIPLLGICSHLKQKLHKQLHVAKDKWYMVQYNHNSINKLWMYKTMICIHQVQDTIKTKVLNSKGGT